MPQEVDGGDTEDALGGLHHQAMLLQAIEEEVEMARVLLFISAGNEDVVEVDEDKGQVVAHPVHHPLEGLGSVLEAEGHPQEFPETEGGNDGGFGDVFGMQGDLMVAMDQVHLGEDLHPL